MIPVHERFHSFQGEGVHMGRSAFFIRTFGCPLHCPWCDSAGTWHPDYVPKHINRVEEVTLVQEAMESQAEFVVVTGGEPAIHDLRELTKLLSDVQMPVHLETSGAFPLKGTFDWVTLSPKYAKLPPDFNVKRANEFKFIIESAQDIYRWGQFLHENGWDYSKQPIWLHPEWSKAKDPATLHLITEAVKKSQGMYRAGYQLHKLYKADLFDNRSAVAVPLGGNPQLGY